MKLLVRSALLPCVLAAGGCREESVLSPHGLQSAEIAQLSWILFAGGAAILLIVIGATWIAVRGPANARSVLATPRMVVLGGIVFPATILIVLLLVNIGLMESLARPPADKAPEVRITVIGEQWWWRIAYRGENGPPVPSANEIRIPVGRDVLFTLNSADVIHSFWIPSLGGKMDMIPGRETRLRMHATRPGVFRGPCAEYCGGPHALMALQVIAMPADAFDAWLAHEAGAAPQPAIKLERGGLALFIAAGCGACHAVRGTPAAGVIGPDLTRIGSRRTIAAGALPLNHDNLVRFIADGQRVKPGNTMPEYRVLSDDQRNALAAYLMSLK